MFAEGVMTAAVVRSVLEWCAEKHISCARLGTKLYCGAHQVQAADTKMYTMTSLPIRKSGEICAKKGMGLGVRASLPLPLDGMHAVVLST